MLNNIFLLHTKMYNYHLKHSNMLPKYHTLQSYALQEVIDDDY